MAKPKTKGACAHPRHAVEMRTDIWYLERRTICGLAAMNALEETYSGYYSVTACAECSLFDCTCPRGQ